MSSTEQVTPWYKEAWVWFFLGILGLGIAAGSIMFVIGMSNPPEMVVGDYARFARGLVDTNERASQAQRLGLTGSLTLEDDRILIKLEQTSNQPLPTNLLILFHHPATSDADFTVRLSEISDGQYTGELTQAPNPRSKAIVFDLAQTWWLSTADHDLLNLGPVKLFPHRL